MQAKRFIAADMRRALDMVKTEFGEDAMILSTERTAKGVELVATGESDLSEDPINNPSYGLDDHTKTSGVGQQDTGNANSRFQSVESGISVPVSAKPFTSAFDSQSHRRTSKGLASGKTQDELAQEMELANRKMLAARKAENMTLEKWADIETAKLAPASEAGSASRPNASITSHVGSHTEAGAARHSSDLVSKTEAAILREQQQKSDDEISRLHLKINDMRNTLEIQLSEMAGLQERQLFESQQRIDTETITPVAIEIRQQLNLLGLRSSCNDQLMSAMNDDTIDSHNKQMAWTRVLAELANKIPYDASDIVAKGGIYAFLGTTGVGKTTTIAKLATRYVMKHGPENIVLLTTDNYRIASHTQLTSLAKILNISIEVVEVLDDLPNMVARLTDKALVLIDTPGMSYSDPLLKPHLSMLKECPSVSNLLVLSSSSQYQMMKASLHSYRIAGLKGCVLTKLDESASLGDAMSMLSEHRLPLSYITDGQAVPDDIAVVKSSQLITRAVKLLRSQHTLEQQIQNPIDY